PGGGERAVGHGDDAGPVVGVQRGVEVQGGEGVEQVLPHLGSGATGIHGQHEQFGRATSEVVEAADARDDRLAAASEVHDHAGNGEVLEPGRRPQRYGITHVDAVPVAHGVGDQYAVE